MRRMMLAATAIIAMTAGPALAAEWQTKESPHSVADTVDALTGAIEKAGARVMAVVDHQANAASADLDLPPTTLVIFGNPKIGTPLMQENRRVALDLPQKVLIWEENGVTQIGYLQPQELADRYGLDAGSQSITTMVNALGKLTDAAIAE